MKYREADIRKSSKRRDKSRASVPQEGILRIIETKYTPNRKVTWGLHGKTHVKVVGDAVQTVKGYFDIVTGLSTITETPEGRSTQPDAAASELFDVLVIDRHTFQVAPTALRCLYNYSDEEIQRFVVPKRTLARRFEKNEVLTVEETDKAVRLARVDKLAAKVFGDAEKAHRWLRKPKSSLSGETPLAYLSTEAGARAVEDMLHQIDHGILP